MRRKRRIRKVLRNIMRHYNVTEGFKAASLKEAHRRGW